MSTHCRKTCNMCPHQCYDRDGAKDCERLAKEGACTKFRQYMEQHCKKSCLFCTDPWHLTFRPFEHPEHEALTCAAQLVEDQECKHSALECGDGLFCPLDVHKCKKAPKKGELCEQTVTRAYACGKGLYCK